MSADSRRSSGTASSGESTIAPASSSGLGCIEYISPDLSHIVTLRYLRDETPHYGLYLGTVDGSDEVLYHERDLGEVVWAPDSSRFACWLGEERRYYLGGPGAELVPISEPSDAWGGLSWIDSAHFVYRSGAEGRYELRVGTVGQPSLLLAGPTPNLGGCNLI